MNIENWFTYHKPFGTQTQRYTVIREHAKRLALAIERSCPESPERDTAIMRLRESVMLANASIACNEVPDC